MKTLELIYDHVPIFIQNLMVSVKGMQKAKGRYGKLYYQYRDFCEDFDTWPLQKKLDYQQSELVRFVRHAYEKSPFYRELYEGIDINAIRGIEDLKKLPIVDKEMLRLNMKNVFTIPLRNAVEGHTGGTTGKSLVVRGSSEDRMKRMALLDHFKSRVGFENRKMRRATFNGKHIVPPGQKQKNFWRYNSACQQMIFSSFHLTEENMGYYVRELNRFKPDALDGFFVAMYDLAGYMERHNIRPEFRPIAIFPTSETLTPSGRELLERVFDCKVYDQYSSSEGAPFVGECKDQHLHVELATGVFEHFESDNDEVLLTSFTTHGTPLIRYRIGDSMTFSPSKERCSCGMESTMVLSIEGRKLDFLYTAKGARINGGNTSNIFKNLPNAVIRAQFIQHRMDEIRMLIEIDPNLFKPEYDDLLRKEFAYKFGYETKLIIEHVDEIPREKSGKFRMIKNNVAITP